jgi:hypothetical protein
VSEPDVAADYQERESRAALSVLIELGQVLGEHRERFVVVGGAVPWLLLPNAQPPHVGTLDIDIDLDPDALSEGAYAELIEKLERAGYERNVEGLKPFQLRRRVKVDDGAPVGVIVDLLMPREARPPRNRPALVEGLRVQGADGASVALVHHQRRTLEGRMPDGRSNRVEVLVASIPALLAMKGYALVQRDKKKDAYDIYFCVRNFPGGPEALAGECRALLGDEVAKRGFVNIAEKFAAEDGFGPATVRMFLAESDLLGGMTAEQIQTDAYMQLRAWSRALGLGG